jgi:GNAT superfamily N-acetyltransferase
VTQVEVRPAEDRDLEALARVLAPLPLFTAYGLTAEKLRERFTTALSKHEGLLVATVDGAPVGVCWYLPRGAFGAAGYLRTLALADGHRGEGIGVQLLEAYERGCNSPPGGWFLLASDFNTGAHRFYERHGYRQVGELPGFAALHVNERIYWKAKPSR